MISKNGPSAIGFADGTGSEIVATYNISAAQSTSEYIQVNFLEYANCNTTVYNQEFSETIGNPVDTGDANFKNVDISIKLEKDDISSSTGVWDWKNDTAAELKFCTRVDLVTTTVFPGLENLESPIADTLKKSLGYVKVKYFLTIDMTNNFQVTIAVEEDPKDESDIGQTAKVTYTVNACQCTLSDKVCIDGGEILSQNELLNVCVYPTQDDIIIKNVQSYLISQGDLAVSFITPEATNSLTAVSGLESDRVSISTVLISAFFINPADVVASGTVTLAFGDTNRRQLSRIDVSEGRALQIGGAGEGTGAFDISASLTPLGEEASDEYDNIDPSSALTLNVYNGAIATFAMAAAVVGLL